MATIIDMLMVHVTDGDEYSQRFDVLMPDGRNITVVYNVNDGWCAVLWVRSKRSSYTYKKVVTKHRAIEAAKASGAPLPSKRVWISDPADGVLRRAKYDPQL